MGHWVSNPAHIGNQMITDNQQGVKSYPVITATAIRSGLAAPARVYELVQALAVSRNGSPFFTRADLIALDLLSEQQVDRALAAGLGIFWTRTPLGDYHMTSRAKVAVALGHVGKPGRAVTLPLKAFTGRLSNFKAHTYAGYLGQLRRQSPSRNRLCEVFGVSLPTLLAWERRSGVKPRPRLIMADPANLDGATGTQEQQAAIFGEIDRNRGGRVWISVVGPRGGIKAGRRLMDSENQALDDYWSVVEAPTWEINAQPVITWQTTNDYSNTPLGVAPSGRGSWLHADIKRLGSPDMNAMGGKPSRSSSPRPGWHDDPATADKWQGRRWNRVKPAIIAQYVKTAVTGTWRPSRAAVWGELSY